MHQILYLILSVGILNAEVSNGPLVYPNWPPKSSQHKSSMIYHQTQSQLPQQNRLQSMYQMRLSPTASRYSSSTLAQSPSNMIYTQTKHRPQYQTYTMPLQKQTQSQPQPKRIVMRPQSPKMHSSLGSASNSYIMSSVKPYHTSSHPLGSESHNIYYKQPQNSPSTMGGKPHFGGVKNAHKTVDYVFENPFANEVASLPTLQSVGSPYYIQNHPTLNSYVFQLKGNHLVVPSTSTLPMGNHQTQIQHFRLQNDYKPQQQQHTKPKYNPIHTISAPDLTLLEQKPLANYINRPIEMNHISEKDIVGAYNQQRPISVSSSFE